MGGDAARQHWLDTMVTQRTLMDLSDNPIQFQEDPLSALMRQAWRAREGYGDANELNDGAVLAGQCNGHARAAA
jgi:hypothetical protein